MLKYQNHTKLLCIILFALGLTNHGLSRICDYASFPVVYVVLSEIFPMGVRGRAVSVVSAVNWATNLLISMTFLTITGVCVVGYDLLIATSI